MAYSFHMTNSWMNEDGEPIMDGAAWRFEQQLDQDSRADYMEDHFYDDYDEDECEDDHECDSCDGPEGHWDLETYVFVPDEGAGWTCSYCDRPCPPDAHKD